MLNEVTWIADLALMARLEPWTGLSESSVKGRVQKRRPGVNAPVAVTKGSVYFRRKRLTASARNRILDVYVSQRGSLATARREGRADE
jgi:hypothetical protein